MTFPLDIWLQNENTSFSASASFVGSNQLDPENHTLAVNHWLDTSKGYPSHYTKSAKHYFPISESYYYLLRGPEGGKSFDMEKHHFLIKYRNVISICDGIPLSGFMMVPLLFSESKILKISYFDYRSGIADPSVLEPPSSGCIPGGTVNTFTDHYNYYLSIKVLQFQTVHNTDRKTINGKDRLNQVKGIFFLWICKWCNHRYNTLTDVRFKNVQIILKTITDENVFSILASNRIQFLGWKLFVQRTKLIV